MPIETTDTTGQMIATYTDSGTKIMIGRDTGSYEGCKPEYNVRKIAVEATLDISITHPAYKAITDRGNGYGMGYGDTGMLYPVTEADIAALREIHNAERAERKAKTEAAEREEEQYITDRNNHPGWCNKCHSYCYGDCTAHHN